MKLASPKFESAVRRQAKAELRANPAKWKEYKRRRAGLRYKVNTVQASLWSLWIVVVAVGALTNMNVTLALLATAFYVSATVLHRSNQFAGDVLSGQTRNVLFYLPISDGDFFNDRWIRYFRMWILPTVVTAVLYRAKVSSWPLVLLSTVLQMLCAFALSCWVLGYKPQWTHPLGWGAFYAAMVATVFIPDFAVNALWLAIAATPAGWISHGVAALVGAAPFREYHWFWLAFALAASLPFAYRAPRRMFVPILGSQIIVDRQEAPPTSRSQRLLDMIPATPEATTDDPIAARFEAPDLLQNGWLERFVGGRLSGREKDVIDFMLAGESPRWSKMWLVSLCIQAFGWAVLAALPKGGGFEAVPAWILVVAMIVGWPLLGGRWPGFGDKATSRCGTPPLALVPVGFTEVSRLMFKVNAIRSLAWAPVAFPYLAFYLYRVGIGRLVSIVDAACVLVLLVAPQIVSIALSFSNGAGSSNRGGLGSQVALILTALLCIGLMFCGVLAFTAETLLPKIAFALGGIILAALVWLIVRRLYDRGRLNLLYAAK